MTKKLKRMLCLLLVLAASCAILTVAVSAAEQETSVQARAATLTAPAVTKLEKTSGGIRLTWGKVSGAAQYRVYLKTDSGWTALGNTTSTSYTYPEAVGGQSYTFTVRCVSADGRSFTSGFNATGWTYTVYVAQPAIKTIENRATGVKLTWDAVPGAERYRIYVKTPGGTWDYVGNTMGNTFTYIWAESGQDYIFTIRCANKDNNRFTSTCNTTGWRITYIGQPRVTEMESAYNGVKLTWSAVSGAARYRVYVKQNGLWKNMGSTTGTSYVVPVTGDGVEYTFTVRCVNASNTAFTSSFFESGWKHTFEASPLITRLETVSGGVKLTWSKPSGVERYRIYVKQNGTWKYLGSTTGNTYTYRAVESGKTYTFTVRGVNAANTEFTTTCNPYGWSFKYVDTPVISGLQNVSNGVKLTWSAVPGADRYRVYVKQDGTWKCVGSTTGTSYVYDQAVSGESYSFTLRCTNAADTAFTSYCDSTGWSTTYVAQPEVTELECTDSGIKLTWNAVAGAGRYRVYVMTDSGWVFAGVTTGTSFTFTEVQAGEEYTFTVRCTNAAGNAFTSSYDPEGWSIVYE